MRSVPGGPATSMASPLSGPAGSYSSSLKRTGEVEGPGPETTRTCVEPATPLAAVAVMVASPAAIAVATPPLLTVATAGVSLAQVNAVPATGCPLLSSPVALSTSVAPMPSVAPAGDTDTLTTGAGGPLSAWSLQAPKELAAEVFQVPSGFRARDSPTGPLPFSSTPMSVAVSPIAGPSAAAIAPSYDRNSTTAPPASTSARASGEPFWMPLAG